ncbi:hypothetical protein [Ihuprevotella massiliensis]|uniref:hypothetical protein n=1 Tax=Ihuprevotella massiliensis TaxID=1852368 RepID=UPI0015B3C94E
MDFFQKNSHVFRISWEKIEVTREKKREKQKERRNIHKGIHGKNKNKSTAETKGIHGRTNPWQKQKGIHGRNRKRQNQVKNKSTVKTKRNPRQKQKGFHTK